MTAYYFKHESIKPLKVHSRKPPGFAEQLLPLILHASLYFPIIVSGQTSCPVCILQPLMPQTVLKLFLEVFLKTTSIPLYSVQKERKSEKNILKCNCETKNGFQATPTEQLVYGTRKSSES